MSLTARQYAVALYKSLSETSDGDHDKVLDRFVQVLHTNSALGLSQQIEEEFRRYDSEAKGIRLAEVTSARELTQTEEKKIIKELNSYVAGEVEIKKKIDKELVGGVVIKLDDELIDGSVKRQLKELKDKLTN